jgi:hypothetical protein
MCSIYCVFIALLARSRRVRAKEAVTHWSRSCMQEGDGFLQHTAEGWPATDIDNAAAVPPGFARWPDASRQVGEPFAASSACRWGVAEEDCCERRIAGRRKAIEGLFVHKPPGDHQYTFDKQQGGAGPGGRGRSLARKDHRAGAARPPEAATTKPAPCKSNSSQASPHSEKNQTQFPAALKNQSQFLVRYASTLHCLLHTEGSLPLMHRCYIAIMGASRHRCEALVRHLAEMFLLGGGDSEWLTHGTAPEKLKVLEPINAIIAHQPWNLAVEDLQELLDPIIPEDPDLANEARDKRWSKTELLLALTILATFHSISGLYYGLGIALEDP